ncbi:hypothetical protein [Actinomadura sp. 9N407]|uniref:hypothetical protein n=1 Tax=Actinomadura sp. 9N407 TaxID=3375154 RepID=UPI0037AA9FE5
MAEVFRYRPRRLAAGGVFLAAVVLGSVGMAPEEVGDVGTESLVRAFYEAIKERDVGKALRLAKAERPGGEEGRFLVPEAIDDDWKIASVTERSNYEFDDYAEVVVVLEGKGGERYRSEVRLLKEKGGMRIDQPLARVWFGMTPMTYVEVGKVRIPFKLEADHERTGMYWLLPGLYRFYQGRQGLVRGVPEQTMVNTGDGSSISSYPPTQGGSKFDVTPAGERAVSQAYNAYIDKCAKARGQTKIECPFGYSLTGGVKGRNASLSDLKDVRWKVRKYPTIAAIGMQGELMILDREQGIVELSGTGQVGDGGPRKRFTLECEVLSNRLHATVGIDGRITVIPAGSRISGARSHFRVESCRDRPISVK